MQGAAALTAEARPAGAGSAPSRTVGYRPYLDGLRCVAVYLVVAFHAGLGDFRGGFIGVDVFFVLSGYLVTRILLRDLSSAHRIDLRRFYARRFRRILPAAAVTLVVTALLYAVIATPFHVLDSLAAFRAAFCYVANWHFISQATDYFATNVNSSPVLHFWSLAVEEQFYFVWPLLLTVLFRLSRRAGRRQWWVLRSIVVAGAAASAIAAVHVGTTNLDRAYYGTDTRAYQLLAGALLALTPQLITLGRRFGTSARWASALGLVGLLGLGSSLSSMTAIWRGVFTVAFTFVLIVGLESSSSGIAGRALSQPGVAYLGRISYATYLWHWPLVILIGLHHEIDPLPLFAISALGSTALAVVSYHLVEHPIRSSFTLDRYRVPVIAAGLTISFVLGLALAPAFLRSTSSSTADASSASVAATGVTSGSATLLDWRKAKGDAPPSQDCYERPVTSCTVVRGKGASVLIIGDSTARMWVPAFVAIAARESLTVSIAAMNLCPWQLDLATVAIPASCPAHRDDWYGRVVPALDPDIIVLSESLNRPGPPVLVRDAHGRAVSAKSPAGETILALDSERSVSRLRAGGRKVVIIRPAPSGSLDPLNCLSTGSHECSFRIGSKLPGFHRFLRSLTTQPHMWFLDLDRLVCPRLPVCDPVVNDIIVRRDGLHITSTYSRAIGPSIDALLHSTGILTAGNGRG